MTRSLSCLCLLALVSLGWGTELTFDIVGFGNFSNMAQGYGDRVAAATDDDFSYGTAGGFTPNVTVSYGPEGADPAFWTTGYGDLTNILFEDRDRFGILEITFTADAGFEVMLERWDMAAFGVFAADPLIQRLDVKDGSGTVLFSESDVAVPLEGRRTFDHAASPLVAPVIVLRMETGNLGSLSDDIALDNIVFNQRSVEMILAGGSTTLLTRLTYDPGNERLPEWDPRGGMIAFTTDREEGDWNDLGAVDIDGSNERLLAKGNQIPFGLAPNPLSWAGSTGRLITNETINLHEVLAFDVAQAPFTRTANNGSDAAFETKLMINGGGGGGFFKVSRDGSTALWRLSRSGGGGRTTIHTAPYASLNGETASSIGTIHVDEDFGLEQVYLQGAAIAPDGSFFILSQPAGEGHDLWLYTTDKSAEPVALTTSGETSGAWNRFPDISPDGTRVAFTFWSGKEGETNEIYLMAVAGGAVENLTFTLDLSEAWPSWAPDGRCLAFGRFDGEGSPALQPGEEPNTNIYTFCFGEDGPSIPDPNPNPNPNPGGGSAIVAYPIESGTAGNQGWGGSLGLDFNAVEAIQVPELGAFDDKSDGLGRTITVQLWSRDGGNQGEVLAELTFTPESPGTLEGGVRFKPLPSVLNLSPGSYTIVAFGYAPGAEPNGNLPTGFGSTADTPAIEFVGSGRYATNKGWPGTPDGGPENRYGAGNFKFLVPFDDVDGDGWDDKFEFETFGDLSESPTSDADGDTVPNGVEVARGTNPLATDTDSDSLGDAVETDTGVFVGPVDTGTDPLRQDSDGDGLRDDTEITEHGTDPTDRDSDGDGASDGVEIAQGFDPLSSGSRPEGLRFVKTITYEKITHFEDGSAANIGNIAVSANGEKIVYATAAKTIHTLNGDGSDLREIFRYADFRGGCPCVFPYVDISGDGGKVLWTDTVGQIFVANSDGSGRIEVATTFAGPFDSTTDPDIKASPKFTADGSQIYFANSLPGGGSGSGMQWGAIAGVWRVNADGTNLQQVFSYNAMSAAVFGKTGTEYNPNTAFRGFDINAEGSRIVVSTTQETGGVVTWADGVFHHVHQRRIQTSSQVVMSQDGSTIAYNDSDNRTVVADQFAGGNRRIVGQLGGFESGFLGINADGSIVSFDPGGTGGSPSVTLSHTALGELLDLAPLREEAGSFRATTLGHILVDGTTAIFRTPFRDPNGVAQLWRVRLDPASTIGFPQISDIRIAPDSLQADGSNRAVVTAKVTGAGITDVTFDTLLDGNIKLSNVNDNSFGIRNTMRDDGEVQDLAAGDDVFTSRETRAGFMPELGDYTVRVVAITDDRIVAQDVPGLRILDGLPEERNDTDNDGVVDLLEDAFVMSDSGNVVDRLPDATIVEDGGEPFAGIELTVPSGGAMNADGTYIAGGFVFTIEISDDFLTWRAGGDDIVFRLPESLGAGADRLLVRFAESLLAATDSCFMRVSVRRE